MISTEEALRKWSPAMLTRYLKEKSVTLDENVGLTKDELIKKVIEKQNEIKNEKLLCAEKKIAMTDKNTEDSGAASSALLLPEEIEFGWIREYVYNKELTLKSVKDYAKLNDSEHNYEEGRKIFKTNRVRNVEFNNITANIGYCFLRGVIFPCKQKEIAENIDEKNMKGKQKVWICMDSKTSEILAAGCQCAAHYSNACSHVFALLHFITTIVSLRSRATNKEINKSRASKRRARSRKTIMAECKTSEDENNEEISHINTMRWREEKKSKGAQEERFCVTVDTKGEQCTII